MVSAAFTAEFIEASPRTGLNKFHHYIVSPSILLRINSTFTADLSSVALAKEEPVELSPRTGLNKTGLNKISFLVLLFLLSSNAIQCMKRKTPETNCHLTTINAASSLINIGKTPRKTVQNIKDDCFALNKTINNPLPTLSPYEARWDDTLSLILYFYPKITELCPNLYTFHINARDKGYSTIGSIIISPLPFQEKKYFIQELIKHDYKLIPEDQELALLEKLIRCDSTIKNISLFYHAHKDSSNILSQISQDLINLISLIMFNTYDLLL